MRENESIGDYAQAKVGLQTGDNNRFLRYWFEVETFEYQALVYQVMI